MKKDFKTTATAGAERFISTPATQDTQDTQATPNTFYRINLKLDGDLQEFLAYQAWRNTVSITAIVNKFLHDSKDKWAGDFTEEEQMYFNTWKKMQNKKEGAK